MPTGCGNSGGNKLSLEDVPRYPNATEGTSMAHSLPGGFAGGELKQFTTRDSFDDVLDFYWDALDAYSPQELSHESKLGRQTALNIRQGNSILSVAIQELTREGTVHITLMATGA